MSKFWLNKVDLEKINILFRDIRVLNAKDRHENTKKVAYNEIRQFRVQKISGSLTFHIELSFLSFYY